ncbi:Mss4-like protein, partial [Schizophyllum fasciatum]
RCRLWTGSICLTAICFPASSVSFLVDSDEVPYHRPPPLLKSYQSSPGVLRQFCGVCGSNMFYYDEKGDRVDACGGTLKELKDVRIRSQIFCDNMIPGIEVGPMEEGVELMKTREGKWEAGKQ